MVNTSLRGSIPRLPRWLSRQSANNTNSQPAKSVNGINVSLEDRWLILGTTGTGKTTFAKKLLTKLAESYSTVPMYVLDSKALGDFKEWEKHGLVTSERPPDAIKSGVQVWQPGVDDQDAYDEWFNKILHSSGACMVLIDEISSLRKGKSNEAPANFQRLLKQGRAAGKLIINCTQEMAYNPRQIITQTTHIVGFRMGGEYDRLNINKLLYKANDAEPPTKKHGFFYRRTDNASSAIEYSDYKDFF